MTVDYRSRLASLRRVLEPSAAYKASIARMERERLSGLCDERGVPREAGVRAVCLAELLSPTQGNQGAEEAVAWREARRVGVSAPGVLRYIMGPRGSGKSSAVGRCVARHSHSALFVSAHEIGSTQRTGWSTTDDLWKVWRKVDLLGIDDVGAERADPELIADLFFARLNSGLLTLCTGNIQAGEMMDRYGSGGRIADRLVNGQGLGGAPEGLKWFVVAGGPSLRDPKNVLKLVGGSK